MPFFLMENECVLWCMRGAKSADYASAFMASDNHLSKINMAFQNLESVLDTLKTQGASTIEITYFGEGDDGAIEPPSLKTCTAGYDSEAIEAALDSGPGDTLIAFVEHILGPGWENGTGLSGTVIFDLTTDTITHSQEEEVIQCNYNEDTYTLKGDLLRSKTDSEKNPAKALVKIKNILREYTTEQKLLAFWVLYPEIKSITIYESMEMDDEGGWTAHKVLTNIEFIDDKAEETLRKRLELSEEKDSDDLYWWGVSLFIDEKGYTEDKKLFNGEFPDIEEKHLGFTLERPEDPEEVLSQTLYKIRSVLDSVDIYPSL